MELPQFVEQTEPDAVFTLLSDDNRIDILRTLWKHGDAMTFSELHSAVEIEDSGQFNYHLDKLVGEFVTKEESGYRLTVAGRKINGAIEAGSYTASGSLEPVELDGACPTCGGTRVFYYEDEEARLECASCEFTAEFAVPPSAFVDCSRDEIPTVAGEYLRSILHKLEDGFCTACDAPVDREVLPVTESSAWSRQGTNDDELTLDVENVPIVQYDCRRCVLEPTAGLTLILLTHPEVVSFFLERGIDIRERPLWEVTTFGADHERIRRHDPFRAAVTYVAGDDELVLVVDDDLTVVDIE